MGWLPRRGLLWRRAWMALGACTLLASIAAVYAADGSSPPLASPRAPTSLPAGFRDEVLVAGFDQPTAFAFLPDGRILVAEKTGVVRLADGSRILPIPFLDLRSRVNEFSHRGLLGIAADPQFEQNGFVYVLYTYDRNPLDPQGPKRGVLSRFFVRGDRADASTETVILGAAGQGSCAGLPRTSDCIPQDSDSHTGGALRFAADGSLFVTLGDGAASEQPDPRAFRAQDVDSLAGKILRISSSGAGLRSNPFWNGDPGANRSKVWALGLRNAYRYGLNPVTGTPYLGDVGWRGREEVSLARAGANLGWPCFEGEILAPGYGDDPLCKRLLEREQEVTRPLVSWPTGLTGGTVTGGAFADGSAYPPPYRGSYFYGDFVGGWLSYITVDDSDRLVGGPSEFGPALTPVDIQAGPGGEIYYLSFAAGELRRIVFQA